MRKVFVYELNATISCSFNPLWAARLCNVYEKEQYFITSYSNKARYTAQDAPSTRLREGGWMDGRTDTPSYRDARTQSLISDLCDGYKVERRHMHAHTHAHTHTDTQCTNTHIHTQTRGPHWVETA